ncbi:MAG TPA: MFS transporter [Phototrophicaceae bacterium]|nr:MFS transporter [Phototrophicaceae bacterium]
MASLTHAESINPAQQPKRSMTAALRSPNFRLYFGGQLVSISGTWIQNIAQGYLVFLLTKSELWLGIVACAAGLPVLLMAPFGGVIVDRVPRRTILICTQTAQMILAFILAAITFSGVVQVWHVVVLAFLLGVTNTLDTPARQMIIVEMVGRDELESGIAMNSIMNNVGRILGPAVAGLALVQFGTAWCFLLNGLSFVAVLAGLFLMKVPHAIKTINDVPPLRQLREGVEYSVKEPLILALLLITAISGLLSFPITQIMPAFADVILHSPDTGYAAINAGVGVGCVIAGAIFGWSIYKFGKIRLVVGGMLISALAMTLLATLNDIFLASFMCGIYGVFMLLQFMSINTTLQMITPDAFRGRVMSLYSLGLLGFTPFGALAMGAIATAFGTAFSVALYGILTAVLGIVVVIRWPIMLTRDIETPLFTSIEEEALIEQIVPSPVVSD